VGGSGKGRGKTRGEEERRGGMARKETERGGGKGGVRVVYVDGLVAWELVV